MKEKSGFYMFLLTFSNLEPEGFEGTVWFLHVFANVFKFGELRVIGKENWDLGQGSLFKIWG